MRQAILIASLALSSALALAACGGAEDSANTNAAPANARAAAQPARANASPAAADASNAPAAAAAPTAAETPHTHSATTPTAADEHTHGAPTGSVRRISVEEARVAFELGKAVFVDVRGEDAYRQGHIKGALLIPEGEVARNARKLPKNKLIITYCA